MGLGVPVIQAAPRRDALELGRVVGEVSLLRQPTNLAVIGRSHVLDLGVSPEGFDTAAHIQDRLVQRVTERVASIAADDQVSRLGHEGRVVAHAAADYDVNPLHRDAAAQAGIALDHEQPAVPASASGLGSKTLHAHHAGHHVLRHAPAHVAVDGDAGEFVHTAQVIPTVPAYVNVHQVVHTYGDAVRAARVEHLNMCDLTPGQLAVQELVQRAH